MDPVSLIVSALVSGIVTGLQAASAQAVKDSYFALKSAIIKKYGQISIEQLEQAPHSKARQAVVEEDLRNAGADQDREIVRLANSLLSLIDTSDIPSPKPAKDSAPSVEELIEKAERQAGSQAVGQIVDKHINGVMNIRTKYPLNDQDLLSTNIVHNRAVPESVRTEVGQLHKKIRIIIQEVASRIEERKYKSSEEAIEGMHLALTDLQRARDLIQADRKVHVSYQALKTTVEFFADLNQMIIEKIEQATSRQSETNLILGNAIVVYELTDFVIGYIEGFTVQGVTEIVKLHEETKLKVAELRRQQKELEQRLTSTSIDDAVKNQTLDDINARERSIDLLEKEWEKYVEDVKSMRNDVGSIRDKIPTLEIIRDNAKVQINLIQAVAMLQILKNNVNTMKATILTLENMKLISLSPNRVRRLLGVS